MYKVCTQKNAPLTDKIRIIALFAPQNRIAKQAVACTTRGTAVADAEQSYGFLKLYMYYIIRFGVSVLKRVQKYILH